MAHFSEYKKKDGTVVYRVRVVTGYEPDGTPVQESRTFSNKTEAKKGAREWEAQISQGRSGATAKTTLAEYLDEWLQRKARTARPITVAGYTWLVQHTIYDKPLAGAKLGRLTPSLLQTWIDGIPHPATARKARAVLNIALNEATRLGHIAINPMARTTPPAHQPREGTAWSTDNVHRFLAVADHDSYAPFWHLACYLGLRPSEIIGLKWGSVEFEGALVRVERARPTACGKTFESERTKSPSGKRILSVPAPLILRLQEHLAHQQTLRLMAGARWSESGLVCTTGVGTPINHRNVHRHFQRLCARAGVPRIRVYDLRHTATSLMIDAGADLKAASEALGHSDPRITMKVYRHVRGDQRAHALALLAAAIGAPADKGEPA